MEQQLHPEVARYLDEANHHFEAAGVQLQTRFRDGQGEARYLMPLRDGRMMAVSGVHTVVDGEHYEVGRRRRRGRFRRRIKKFAHKVKHLAKKVAKSKAFKAFKKVAKFAVKLVPGGNYIRAGFGALRKAAAIAKRIKHRVRHAVRRVKGAVRRVVRRVHAAQHVPAALPASRAPVVSPLAAGVHVTTRSGRRAIVVFV